MPTLILWPWLSPTQLSLVPKDAREGLATVCLTGAAVVAPAGMAKEFRTNYQKRWYGELVGVS
jgi:hypothetical protein